MEEMTEKRMVSIAGLFGVIGSILLVVRACPILLPYVCRVVSIGDGIVLYDNLSISLAATLCLEAAFMFLLRIRVMRRVAVFGVIGYALMFFSGLQAAFMGAEEIITKGKTVAEWFVLINWGCLLFQLIAFGELYEFLPRKFAIFDVTGLAGLYAWSGICVLSMTLGQWIRFVWVVELVYAGAFLVVFFGLGMRGIEVRERRCAPWIKMFVCLLAVLNLAIAQRGVARRQQWAAPDSVATGASVTQEGAEKN